MKNLFNKKVLLLAFIALVLLPTEMYAADLPAIVVALSKVVTNIIVKVIVGLVVLIMLIYSAWEMKENGNARPLKWALFASVVMGGAVFFGPSILDYAAKQFDHLTGSGSVIVIP